ncbi:MAG: hypothetical protein J6D03_00905 [Clostridia bacterium]|nr:hypothetical protein [Clostridia bacterium]
MKSLKSYNACSNIESQIKNLVENRETEQEKYEFIREYYDSEIPDNIAKTFTDISLNDFINENLLSHNYKLLQKKLSVKLSQYIVSYEDYYGNGDKKSFIVKVNDLNILLNPELHRLLKFFNYYIKTINKIDKTIFVGPLYLESAYKQVWDNNGIGYHFTSSNRVESILKNGLRCKDVSDKQFELSRIYMFSTNRDLTEYDKEYIEYFSGMATNNIWQEVSKYGLAIIKIDLSKLKQKNIEWYKDTFMKEKEAVFTYTNIPSICLSQISVQNITEVKGEKITDQWINDERPIMTRDGRQAIILKIDMKEVPNILHGQVKMQSKMFDYQWDDTGKCIKAVDSMGNPKKTDEADDLVQAI